MRHGKAKTGTNSRPWPRDINRLRRGVAGPDWDAVRPIFVQVGEVGYADKNRRLNSFEPRGQCDVQSTVSGNCGGRAFACAQNAAF